MRGDYLGGLGVLFLVWIVIVVIGKKAPLVPLDRYRFYGWSGFALIAVSAAFGPASGPAIAVGAMLVSEGMTGQGLREHVLKLHEDQDDEER